MFDMSGHALTVRGPKTPEERERGADLVVVGEDLASVTVIELHVTEDDEQVVVSNPFGASDGECEMLKRFARLGSEIVAENEKAVIKAAALLGS